MQVGANGWGSDMEVMGGMAISGIRTTRNWLEGETIFLRFFLVRCAWNSRTVQLNSVKMSALSFQEQIFRPQHRTRRKPHHAVIWTFLQQLFRIAQQCFKVHPIDSLRTRQICRSHHDVRRSQLRKMRRSRRIASLSELVAVPRGQTTHVKSVPYQERQHQQHETCMDRPGSKPGRRGPGQNRERSNLDTIRQPYLHVTWTLRVSAQARIVCLKKSTETAVMETRTVHQDRAIRCLDWNRLKRQLVACVYCRPERMSSLPSESSTRQLSKQNLSIQASTHQRVSRTLASYKPSQQ